MIDYGISTPLKKRDKIYNCAKLDFSVIKDSTVPPYTEVFFTVSDYAGKADLSMGYGNPERKLGVAGHF